MGLRWMDVGGQGELQCLQAGGKPEYAATATVIARPEAPAQISPCYSWFSPRKLQTVCTRQRRNRDTGVGSDPAKARKQIRGKARNYFPPSHLYHCINVPFTWLFTFTKPHG